MTAASPDPGAPKRERVADLRWTVWLRQRLWRGRSLGLALRLLLVPVLVVLGLLAYLSIVGFPSSITDRFLDRMRKMGAVTELRRLRFDLLDGITAEGVAFYTEEDLSHPLLEAGRVVLRLDLFEALGGRQMLKGLRIRNGVCRLGVAGSLREADAGSQLALRALDADLVFERGGVRVSRMSGELLGIRIEGEGFVVQSPHHARTAVEVRPLLKRPLALITEAVPDWVPLLVEQLNEIEFEDEAQARLDFTWHPHEPQLTEVTVTLEGGRIRGRGVTFDRWHVDADLAGTRLEVPEVKFEVQERSLDLSGFLDLTTRVSEVHLQNDLPTAHWQSLIPIDWRDRWNESGCQFFEPPSCEVHFGPAQMGQLTRHFAGWCSFEEAELKGVWLDEAYAHFQRDGSALVISNVTAVVGRDAARGPANGWLRYEMSDDSCRGALTGRFDPNALLPALTQHQQRFLRPMQFGEHPPFFDVSFGGQRGVRDAFYWTGLLRATNFFYNGVFVQSFGASAGMSNRVLTMDPLLVNRPEGTLKGSFSRDFRRQTLDIEAVSSADPKMVARAIGPNTERMCRLYRVEGPTHAVVGGVIDLGSNGLTRLDVSAVATNFGIKWFLADSCSFNVRAEGSSISVTNIMGRMHGGAFQANARFANLDEPSNHEYKVDFAFTNLALAQVVAQLRQTDTGPYRGKLSGAGYVAGVMGEGRGDTVTGGGYVGVRDGYLFKIPLLGGLSSMLSLLSPRWDFASQTDCSANFTVAHRKVVSDDIRIDGKLIRLTSKGSYGFDRKLDFDVKVKPQGEGVVAELVQLLTRPVTMLLSFHLGGTLEDPHWRPENLPKELFLMR